MSDSTVLHKEGDQFAIVTTAPDEQAFRGQFAAALADLIEADAHPGDWAFQINGWLEPASEVIAKLRGYKANVIEKRTLIAGAIDPQAAVAEVGRAAVASE